jgi:hypothetical protein
MITIFLGYLTGAALFVGVTALVYGRPARRVEP